MMDRQRQEAVELLGQLPARDINALLALRDGNELAMSAFLKITDHEISCARRGTMMILWLACLTLATVSAAPADSFLGKLLHLVWPMVF